MKHFSRLVVVCAIGALAGITSLAVAEQHSIVAQDPTAMLGHGSQGYLGVELRDIDNDRAAALKLKDVTGAEIIMVDRDAPAGKAGLHPHDVVLQMNGQAVAGEEQFRRMLHETPAGRTISLVISRDGQQRTVSIQLADRATLEQDAWSQHTVVPAPDGDDGYILQGPSDHGFNSGSGFFGAFSLGSPSVGVELDVLGSQLADYFGVKNGQGLLVKHVADNSPASRAGLKAGDVITSANGQTMATLNEWVKMLHANRGKQVQVTLVRNHKEQTVTLDAVNGKSHGQLLVPEDLQMMGQANDAAFNCDEMI
jgi:S1-C subfamily serine protease